MPTPRCQKCDRIKISDTWLHINKAPIHTFVYSYSICPDCSNKKYFKNK